MSVFRAGVAPINIELLRYGPAQRPVEERKCIFGCGEVETETHVLTQCPLYDDIREEWFHHLSNVIAQFEFMSDEEKSNIILSNSGLVRINAKACYEILMRRRTLLYV